MKDFFKKLFGNKSEPQSDPEQEEVSLDHLTPDERFVLLFKKKGGKLLYCENENEIEDYLKKILEENTWESVYCTDEILQQQLNRLNISATETSGVFYTQCENLIARDGSILFSSNQLGEKRLNTYPENFIVFARTSQFVVNKDESLTGIKFRFKDRIPTNISAVTDYQPHKEDPNFMNYGNLNSKNLYLILLEDL